MAINFAKLPELLRRQSCTTLTGQRRHGTIAW
jgi:hypothetical protein